MVATTVVDLLKELYQANWDELSSLHGRDGGRLMINVVKLLRVYGG
jgi:hypothetical protein